MSSCKIAVASTELAMTRAGLRGISPPRAIDASILKITEDIPMGAAFTDAIAETRAAFVDAARNASALFFEVYSGIPDEALEALFDGCDDSEKFLRFDLEKHSREARSRFLRLDDLERRAYGLADTIAERPLPYFGAFVFGIGHVGIAWTIEEVRGLIARTRRDEARMRRVAELTGTSDVDGHA